MAVGQAMPVAVALGPDPLFVAVPELVADAELAAEQAEGAAN